MKYKEYLQWFIPIYFQYFGIPLAKRKFTAKPIFLYTLYITHYQAFYGLKIVRVSFDNLKKKALPLQSTLEKTIKN